MSAALWRGIALAALACAACEKAPAAASRPGKATSRLQFDSIGKDVGTIDWPGGTTATFTFRNPTSKRIGILGTSASCGCSSVKARIVKDGQRVRDERERGETTGPILDVEPGETGELVVRFETRGFTGDVREKRSIITVQTDEPDTTSPVVFLNAKIRRAYEVTPSHAVFEPMGVKQRQTKHVDVLVLDPTLAPPFGAKTVSAPGGVSVEFHEHVRAQRGVIEVRLTAGPGLPKQGLTGEVVIEANVPDPSRLAIPFTIPVVPDVFTAPRLFDFQLVEPDRRAESMPVTLSLLDPDRKLALGAPRIDGESSDRLTLKVTPVEEGTKYQLVLVAESGFPAAPPHKGIHGLVQVPTGLADFPELRLEYRAYTRAAAPQR